MRCGGWTVARRTIVRRWFAVVMAEECAACGMELEGSAVHCCMRSGCMRAVHSFVMCTDVWMPDYGAYFCSKSCVRSHNLAVVQEFESIPPMDRPDAGPALIPMRRRPDAAVEPDTTPGVRVLSAHSGSDFEHPGTIFITASNLSALTYTHPDPSAKCKSSTLTPGLSGQAVRAHPSGAMSTLYVEWRFHRGCEREWTN